MTPTITSTLAALSNVGNTSITVRLNRDLFPLEVTCAVATRHPDLSLTSAGDLTIRANGDGAWHALREFTQDLLASTRHAE